MISRATLLAGPGFVTAPGTVKFRVLGKITVTLKWTVQNVTDALLGPWTKVVTDRWLEADFTPEYNDPTNTTALFFPYITANTTPVGTQIFTTSDTPWTFTGNNGLVITFAAGAVVQMPDIYLGADGPVYGPMKVIGIIASGDDPTTAANFYAITAPGTPPTLPAVPGSATLSRQKWSAAYGTNSGWSALQSYKGWRITHELSLNWDACRDSGQRIGALLTGYRPMCKFMPSANTIAQMFSQMAFAGTGASQGQLYTANENDMVITGATAGVVTLKAASIESGAATFAADELNQGEMTVIGNVATVPSGTTGPLVFTSF